MRSYCVGTADDQIQGSPERGRLSPAGREVGAADRMGGELAKPQVLSEGSASELRVESESGDVVPRQRLINFSLLTHLMFHVKRETSDLRQQGIYILRTETGMQGEVEGT